MPEQPRPDPRMPDNVQERLHELSRRLRDADHLQPDAQSELADLMDELANTLNPATLRSTDAAHLAESTAHLAQVLNRPQERGLLAAAKRRLEDSILRAESEVPLASSLARNFLDILANLGI